MISSAEKMRGILEPCPGASTWSGEHRLLRAMIEVAVLDHDSSHAPTVASARDWIADDGDGTCTFRWTCEHLGLDPEATRAAIRAGLPVIHGREMTRLPVSACEFCGELRPVRKLMRRGYKDGAKVSVCLDCTGRMPQKATGVTKGTVRGVSSRVRERMERIYSLRAQGRTAAEIAATLGVSQERVRQHIREMGR